MFTMWPRWLPPCQNKPLHHSAKDLNHLSSDTSSCYLDNCQQEQAFPFSRRHAVVPSCSLLTILHTWSQREGVRMPIIFTICCAGYSWEAECFWLPWLRLTVAWTWDTYKSTQKSTDGHHFNLIPFRFRCLILIRAIFNHINKLE